MAVQPRADGLSRASAAPHLRPVQYRLTALAPLPPLASRARGAMPKTRFTAADVAAAAACVRGSCLGRRVSNVYDINARTYLLKLQPQGAADGAPDAPDDGAGKTLLLLESGIRFHTTAFMRDKGDQPSGVCAKFRQHLRGRRLTDVRQLGADRIVVFTFGAPRPPRSALQKCLGRR